MSIKFVQNIDLAGNRITNLAAPAGLSDAATKTYVDGLLGSAINGLAWAPPVRAASTGNVDVANPSSTMDGVNLVTGNRVLLKSQTDPSQNGPYLFNGAASPLTRTSDQLQAGSVFSVQEGTASGDKVYLLTSDGTITVGATALSFAAINAAAGATYTAGTAIDLTGNAIAVKYGSGLKVDGSGNLAIDTGALPGGLMKYAANIGDGTADTITVTHGLASFDVDVTVYDLITGNRIDVMCEVRRPSVNTVSLVFATAPATGAYRVVCIG